MGLPPFVQSDAVRDFVFPLNEVKLVNQNLSGITRFRGTGFFIGSHNYALTAGHAVKGTVNQLVASMAAENGWLSYFVDPDSICHHPTEDVAIFRVEPPGPDTTWDSLVHKVHTDGVRSAFPYYLFGYPDDAAYELVGDDDQVVLRPDLVYSEGHVRRRLIRVPKPQIKGTALIELSGVAGGGCSGSPVISKRKSDMLAGIYVGERITDRATSVGYAIPTDAIWNWVPATTGRTLFEEITGAPPEGLTPWLTT